MGARVQDEELRIRFIRFIDKHIWKTPTGIRCHWLLLTIYYFLYPSRIIWDKNPWFRYDIMRDTITINGLRISCGSLRLLSQVKEDDWLFIVKERYSWKDEKDFTLVFCKVPKEHPPQEGVLLEHE